MKRTLCTVVCVAGLTGLPATAGSTDHLAEGECTVTIALVSGSRIGALTYEIDYSDAAGRFRAEPEPAPSGLRFAVCSASVGDLASFALDVHGQPRTRLLRGGFVAIDTIDAPSDVAVCAYDFGATAPDVADFRVTVTEASNPEFRPIHPLPEVVLSSIECGPPIEGETTTTLASTTTLITTTTTLTTTTTIPTTTTTVPSGPTTTTTTTLPVEECLVSLRLDSAVELGAIQVEIDYERASGRFGSRTAPRVCERTNAVFQTAYYLDHEARRFHLAALNRAGIHGPVGLAYCRFKATGPVAADDFSVETLDAAEPDATLLTPLPTVSVSSVQCPASTATTTTIPPPEVACGQPLSVSGQATTSDVLWILRVAVELETCPACICDVDNSGSIVSRDAFIMLLDAVDLPAPVTCPACS